MAPPFGFLAFFPPGVCPGFAGCPTTVIVPPIGSESYLVAALVPRPRLNLLPLPIATTLPFAFLVEIKQNTLRTVVVVWRFQFNIPVTVTLFVLIIKLVEQTLGDHRVANQQGRRDNYREEKQWSRAMHLNQLRDE